MTVDETTRSTTDPIPDPTADTADTVLRRRPAVAVLAALPLALGVAVILFVTKVIELSLVAAIVVVVIVLVLGGLWGAFGPARPPKGEPPRRRVEVMPPPVSRFDDVGNPHRPPDPPLA